MNDVTVAIVNQFERFNGVVLKHIQETEISNVVGFVFHKDRNNNRFITVAFSDDTEKVYNVDDLAYIALDDSETDETQSAAEKPGKYTLDEIVNYISNDYKRGELKYIEIKDGTVYSFLSAHFPNAPMSLCFKAVMKAWENILNDEAPIDYGEDK